MGVCRIGVDVPVAYAGLHFGEEPPISGHRGSGTIFFAGCNLRCVYCQNHQISQDFDRQRSDRFPRYTVDDLAGLMLDLQEQGAHNINLVSPSHVVPQAAAAIEAARKRGLTLPVVYNSGGYDSLDALRSIRGLVDVYLPDLKYMDRDLAGRLSAASDYPEATSSAIREMFDQVGELEIDGEGVARSGLIVRHLVLPGQLDNSRRCLEFLVGISPSVHLSLMSQYTPQHRARRMDGIDRPLSADEYEEITDFALDLGFENLFIQKLTSQDDYLPDFGRETPFLFRASS